MAEAAQIAPPPPLAPRGWRVWLTAGAVAVVSWPVSTAVPCATSDCSWEFALHASLHGFYRGVPVTNFTYGPLGALSAPEIWFRSTGILAVLVLAAVQWVLLAFALHRAERVLRPALAALIVLIASRMLFVLAAETAGLAVVLIGAAIAERRPQRPVLLPMASGAVVGLLLNVKVSTGLLSLGVAVVLGWGVTDSGWASRIRQSAATAAASFVWCFVIFAAVTGQPGGWPAWLRGSYEETTGFGALSKEPASRAVTYALAELAVILLVTFLLLGVWLRRRRAMGPIALIVAGSFFVEAREGFVRQDGHVGIFLSAVAFLVFAFPLRHRAVDRLAAIAIPCLCFIAYGVAAVSPFSTLADLTNGPRGALTVAQQAFDPGDFRSTQRAGRSAISLSLGIPNVLIAEMQGHPVEVDPFQTAAIFAYGLTWGPSKVYADYQSFTPYLDRSNAVSIANADPDRRVLRPSSPVAIDDHFPAWESPGYQLELACSWREVGLAGGWQLLAPAAERCGASTPLLSVTIDAGGTVSIPHPRNPGDIVTASISLRHSAADQVASRLLKPLGPTYVTLDGKRYRLVVATAGGPLMVRLPGDLPAGPGSTDPIDLDSLSLSGDLAGATVTFREITVGPAG